MSFTILNNMAIEPNVITLAKCLDHRNKMAPTIYTFALSLLLFFLLFQVQALDHHHGITIIVESSSVVLVN